MITKNNVKNISKLALIAFGAATIGLSSCSKDKTTPLNEQFQYDLFKVKQIASVDGSDLKDPSISFTDYDGDSVLDLVVSSENTGELQIFPRNSDGSFSESASKSYRVAPGKNTVVAVGSIRIGDLVHNYIIDSKANLLYQEQDLVNRTTYNSSSSLMPVPVSEHNTGMVSALDVNSDAVSDYAVAKLNDNQDLVNVYLYTGNRLPSGEAMGTYSYDPHPLFKLPNGIKSFAIADIDGDGRLDVSILNKDNSIDVYNMIEHYPRYD